MSFFSDLSELPPATRKFLVFSGINLISWQCLIGQVLILFGRSIEMPAAWVGTLISFMPLTMLMVIFSVPVVERFGPKKILMTTWFFRNMVVLPVLTIPFFIPKWGIEYAWYVLLISTLSFSLVRAFGVASWYPWLHELIPQKLLGRYFAVETVVVQTLTVLVIFGIAKVLSLNNSLNRFYIIYTIGIAAGLISTWYARSIPGGAKAVSLSTGQSKFSGILSALHDQNYFRFILIAIFSLSSIMWLNISSILYLRDVVRFSESNIMSFMAIGAIGVILSVQFGIHRLEKIRSNIVLSLLMAIQSLTSLCWLMFKPEMTWLLYVIPLVIVLGTVCSATFLIFVVREMMSLVQQSNRVAYTSLWIIGTSIANGIPAILAGWLIGMLNFRGYQVCFWISCLSALLVSLAWIFFKSQEAPPVTDIHLIVRPMQPLRSLQRTVWMILGVKKHHHDDTHKE